MCQIKTFLKQEDDNQSKDERMLFSKSVFQTTITAVRRISLQMFEQNCGAHLIQSGLQCRNLLTLFNEEEDKCGYGDQRSQDQGTNAQPVREQRGHL